MDTGIMSKWKLYIALAVLVVSATGCALLRTSFSPRCIRRTEWTYIRVVYLVRDENGLRPVAWSTKDSEILSYLRSEFPRARSELMPFPRGSFVNRVDILLKNGRRWRIVYLPRSHILSIYDYDNPQNVSWMESKRTTEFFQVIRKTVLKETGMDITAVTFTREDYDSMYEDIHNNPHAGNYKEHIWPQRAESWGQPPRNKKRNDTVD